MQDRVDLEKAYERAREDYDVWVRRAKYITQACEQERRDLTADEQKRFDEAMAVTKAIMGGTDADKRYLASVGTNGCYNGGAGWTDYPPAGEGEMDQILPSRSVEHRAGPDPDDSGGIYLEQGRSYVDQLIAARRLPEDAREVRTGRLIHAMASGDRSGLNRAEQRALDSSGGTDHGVAEIVSAEFVDLLRAQSTVLRTRARVVIHDDNKLTFARITGDPSVAWKAENASITPADPTFAPVSLEPSTLAGMVVMSEELIADSVNLQEMVERSLAGAMSVELDRALLAGSGSSNQPLGVANDTTVVTNQTSLAGVLGTTWANVSGLAWTLSGRNVPEQRELIMSTRDAQTIDGFVDADGNPLQKPMSLQNVRMLHSGSVPTNLGTGTNESYMLMADWTSVFISQRLAVQLLIDRTGDRFANYQAAIRAVLRADVVVANPEAVQKLAAIEANP